MFANAIGISVLMVMVVPAIFFNALCESVVSILLICCMFVLFPVVASP